MDMFNTDAVVSRNVKRLHSHICRFIGLGSWWPVGNCALRIEIK